VLGVAVGVFAWLAVESRHEAGAGRTASAPPIRLREIPAGRIELLAQFEPPAADASPPGNAEESRDFRAAMEHYDRRDYAEAVSGLRAAVQAQPEFIEARFYLAICLLLTNDRSTGAEELHRVIAAGDTPYLEPARFYLAKALLGAHNIVGAEQQLRTLIEMHGKLEKQAQSLHAQIVP